MVNKLTILKVLEPFISNPDEELHLAEISRKLNEPHPTVRLHLNYLEDKGIIKKRTKGRLGLFSLNFENPCLIDYLAIAEKNRLIEKCEENLVLKELIFFLRKKYSDVKLIIFGSAAQEFKKAKDVDLLVVGLVDKDEIMRFAESLNIKIHLINVNSLSKITATLRNEIIKKHMIINKTDELIRWLFW